MRIILRKLELVLSDDIGMFVKNDEPDRATNVSLTLVARLR